MSLRLIHTADWHLGQTLAGFDRGAEHAAFLEWLLDRLESRLTDVLLIAGDVFDSANPPAEAQRLYYRFLADAVRRCPGMSVVVVAGNHDSPARLDAPDAVLSALGITVLGKVRDPLAEFDRVCLPLADRSGAVLAHLLAVPFLSPGALTGGVPARYGGCLEAVYGGLVERARVRGGGPLLAAGHLHLAGGRVSLDSERRLLVGGDEAVPAAIFPADLAYVALGHLHLAQALAGGRVRYSGSPIPLSFAERDYPHQVLEVGVDAGGAVTVTPLPVPRAAPMRRLSEDYRLLPDVLAMLAAADFPEAAPGLETLLEVRVDRQPGDPEPVAAVRRVLEGRDVRLASVRVAPRRSEAGGDRRRLQGDLAPEALFARWVREQTGQEPDSELLSAFGELLAEAEREGEAPP